MPKGPLRLAIEDFFFTSVNPEGGPGWWDRVKARWNEYTALARQYAENNPEAANWRAPLTIAQAVIYAVFGTQGIIDEMNRLVSGQEKQNLSDKIADMLSTVFEHPAAREIAEALGTVVTEPILDVLEQYASNPDPDPKEFARAFQGLIMGLNISGGMVDTVLETATGGQVEGVGRLLTSLYWSLGLGFLGWQTLAPLLENGLQPGLERHYKYLYRPKRFSANELRDLYALGQISLEELRAGAKIEGWPDDLISMWVDLAFRTIPQGDIWKLYHEGHINQEEAIRRLRALGYDPGDIPLLFQANPPPERDEERTFTTSTARRAYREHLIDANELQSILRDLRYQSREISLILEIENLAIENENKSLAAAQIKDAWTENVLTDPEARHWLEEAGYTSEAVTIIMETWAAEVVPVYRNLNIGTINGAYVEGILTRTQAAAKLQTIGLSLEDAALELDLTEARNPEAFGNPPPPPVRQLTAGTLSDMVVAGLITPAQMRQRLIDLNYQPGDADLLAEAAQLRATPAARLLPQASIERGYIAGVLNRGTARNLLVALGFTSASANTILDTVEIENPEAFGAPPPERVALLSLSTLQELTLAGVLSVSQFASYLAQLDYRAEDISLLVERIQGLLVPTVRRFDRSLIERAYITAVLTRGQAIARLIELDFTNEDAARILDVVEAEHPEVFDPGSLKSVRLPSIVALVEALMRGLLTEDEYFSRAIELGYRPEDAEMYALLGIKTERKSTRSLTPAQIVNAYGVGLFSRGTALSRLTQNGYSDPDAIILLRMEKAFIEDTEEWVNFINGGLSLGGLLEYLIGSNYSDEDILASIGRLPRNILDALGVSLKELGEYLKETPGGQ